MTEWIRVNQQEPCHICHKPDWCTVAGDGSAACCMRVESTRQMHNGGWLHKLSDPAPRYISRTRAPAALVDFREILRNWQKKTSQDEIDTYAASLGVSVMALEDLGAAWAWPHSAWAWPMRSGAGEIVGIRLRSDSGKWAVTGSHQGVFAPTAWPDMPHEALICEGPTDTAAGLSMGFQAIGRPSCLGCEQVLIETCKRLGVDHIIIVADNDGPGKAGAQKLAALLKMPWKIIVPPGKDLRKWVQTGATKELLECVINQQLWKGVW